MNRTTQSQGHSFDRDKYLELPRAEAGDVGLCAKRLARIRPVLRSYLESRQHPRRCFTNLNQYLTKDLLRAAFHQTRKDGAVGIDGQTR